MKAGILPPGHPLGVSEADIPPTCPLTRVEVMRLWNQVAEDTGTFEHTLMTFAGVLFEAARGINMYLTALYNGGVKTIAAAHRLSAKAPSTLRRSQCSENGPAQPSPGEIEALMARIKFDGVRGCWLWQGVLRTKEYGQFCYAGKRLYAHRRSFELFVAAIPGVLVIDHVCGIHRCINPAHLRVMTRRANSLRNTVGFLLLERLVPMTRRQASRLGYGVAKTGMAELMPARVRKQFFRTWPMSQLH